MTKFETPDDIPWIPYYRDEEKRKEQIQNLLDRGAIPKSELVAGKIYLGSCRNADKARWNGKEFVYSRNKLGYTFDETINHFEDDDGFDVFIPIKII